MKQPDKTIELYKGKIIIDFYERWHQYFRRGIDKKIISVTQATGVIDKSRPLIYWATGLARDYLLNLQGEITEEEIVYACSLHAKIKKEAADTGTQIHDLAHNYIKAKLERKPLPSVKDIPMSDEVANGYVAFLKWNDEHKVKYIATEKIVYSRKYDYVGIMDAKAVVNGELAAVDFKSGNGIYDEMRMQVAAYQQADSEESHSKYGDKWIIRFGKDDGEFHAHQFNNHAKDFKAFLNALELKRRLIELENERKNA